MGSLDMMTMVPCTAVVELTPDERQNINFFNKGNPDHRGVDDYKMINIGKEFNNFFQPCNQLKEEGHIVKMKLPRSFSETRLPNYAMLCTCQKAGRYSDLKLTRNDRMQTRQLVCRSRYL
eukprot:GFUD01001959.1.p1 GENE.GFUD01001959.1~~GFUD01001959.1.p1  ORF type:complete len:120 (-),score=23.37 GFUD01001959.1:446-805(-)